MMASPSWLLGRTRCGLPACQRMAARAAKIDPHTTSSAAQSKKSLLVRERSYVPTELVMLFRQAGFEVEHVWGGTAGDWGRRKIHLDEMEIMVVARKATERSDKK